MYHPLHRLASSVPVLAILILAAGCRDKGTSGPVPHADLPVLKAVAVHPPTPDPVVLETLVIHPPAPR